MRLSLNHSCLATLWVNYVPSEWCVNFHFQLYRAEQESFKCAALSFATEFNSISFTLQVRASATDKHKTHKAFFQWKLLYKGRMTGIIFPCVLSLSLSLSAAGILNVCITVQETVTLLFVDRLVLCLPSYFETWRFWRILCAVVHWQKLLVDL